MPRSASGAMLRRVTARSRPLVLAVAAALFLAAGSGASATVERASSATTSSPRLRDMILRGPARTLLARTAAQFWGGTYTTSTGERVRVFASDAYAADTSFNQVRAEAIAHLPHGSELSSVTAYFLTFDEMQVACGSEALACYSPFDQTLVALGEDAPDGTNAESILAHEYGHHIARNRLNPPWAAFDYGPKRWASSMAICPRERAGEVFPNNPLRYELDPAEGFAEAYRVVTEIRAGRQPQWWDIVDELFIPNTAARAAIEQDVAAPWTQNTTIVRSGRIAATGAGRSRTIRVATPLDGSMRVTVRPPARGAVRLSLSSGSRVLARGSTAVTSVRATVCGQRSVAVRVDRVRGAGAFQLTISRP